MSTPPLPPLPPDLRGLLDTATEGPGPSADQLGRLRARINTTIAGGGGPAGSGGGGLGLGGGLTIAASAVIVAAIAWIVLRPSEPAPMIESPSLAMPAPFADPASAAGPSPKLHQTQDPTPELVPAPPAPPEHVTTNHSDVPASKPPGVGRRTEASVSAPPPASTTDTEPAPVASVDQLARERTLVESARKALAARNLARAIAQLDAHQAEFPDGRLVEEREALMVQALVLVDNPLAAAARARAFRARYPNSIFLALVDAVAPAAKPSQEP